MSTLPQDAEVEEAEEEEEQVGDYSLAEEGGLEHGIYIPDAVDADRRSEQSERLEIASNGVSDLTENGRNADALDAELDLDGEALDAEALDAFAEEDDRPAQAQQGVTRTVSDVLNEDVLLLGLQLEEASQAQAQRGRGVQEEGTIEEAREDKDDIDEPVLEPVLEPAQTDVTIESLEGLEGKDLERAILSSVYDRASRAARSIARQAAENAVAFAINTVEDKFAERRLAEKAQFIERENTRKNPFLSSRDCPLRVDWQSQFFDDADAASASKPSFTRIGRQSGLFLSSRTSLLTIRARRKSSPIDVLNNVYARSIDVVQEKEHLNQLVVDAMESAISNVLQEAEEKNAIDAFISRRCALSAVVADARQAQAEEELAKTIAKESCEEMFGQIRLKIANAREAAAQAILDVTPRASDRAIAIVEGRACICGNVFTDDEVICRTCGRERTIFPEADLEELAIAGAKPYIVDNSRLRVHTFGLAYRAEKRLDEFAGTCEKWGNCVRGVDEGDSWLRVGDCFLPMRYNGVPVLILASEDDELREQAPVSNEEAAILFDLTIEAIGRNYKTALATAERRREASGRSEWQLREQVEELVRASICEGVTRSTTQIEPQEQPEDLDAPLPVAPFTIRQLSTPSVPLGAAVPVAAGAPVYGARALSGAPAGAWPAARMNRQDSFKLLSALYGPTADMKLAQKPDSRSLGTAGSSMPPTSAGKAPGTAGSSMPPKSAGRPPGTAGSSMPPTSAGKPPGTAGSSMPPTSAGGPATVADSSIGMTPTPPSSAKPAKHSPACRLAQRAQCRVARRPPEEQEELANGRQLMHPEHDPDRLRALEQKRLRKQHLRNVERSQQQDRQTKQSKTVMQEYYWRMRDMEVEKECRKIERNWRQRENDRLADVERKRNDLAEQSDHALNLRYGRIFASPYSQEMQSNAARDEPEQPERSQSELEMDAMWEAEALGVFQAAYHEALGRFVSPTPTEDRPQSDLSDPAVAASERMQIPIAPAEVTPDDAIGSESSFVLRDPPSMTRKLPVGRVEWQSPRNPWCSRRRSAPPPPVESVVAALLASNHFPGEDMSQAVMPKPIPPDIGAGSKRGPQTLARWRQLPPMVPQPTLQDKDPISPRRIGAVS